MRLLRSGTALAVLAVAALSAPALAQDAVWLTPTGGSWQTGANWDNNGNSLPPGNFDNALFFLGGETYTVTSGANILAASATVVGNATNNLSDDVTLNMGGFTATFNGFDGTNFEAPGAVVAPGAGNAKLTLLNGTAIAEQWSLVTATNGSATAELVVGAGARFESGISISNGGFVDQVGASAGETGILSVRNGGVYDALQTWQGSDVGGLGIINIDGAGSLGQNFLLGAATPADGRGNLIGNEGAGEMNITNGGRWKSQFTIIGAGVNGSSTGVLNVDGAGSTMEHLTAQDASGGTAFFVGFDGDGEMNITNGGRMTSDFLLLVGLTSTTTGSGVVNVSSGGDIATSQIRVGEDVGRPGQMNVDGAGSTVTDSFGGFVGYEGNGELSVTGGGVVRYQGNGFLGIGRLGTGVGDVVVDGAGSAVFAEGAAGPNIAVGRDGVGSLTVTNGGLAEAVTSDVAIGRNAIATGTVTVASGGTVRGANVYVGGAGGATIGGGGSGTMNLNAGGRVESRGILRVYTGDNINIAGGSASVGTAAAVHTPGTITVVTGGTLDGAGTINGGTVSNVGGTVNPGLSPGILTINGGAFVNGAGGTLKAEIASTAGAGTGHDQLAIINGSASLDGTLDLDITGGPYARANQFVIINGTGTTTVSGCFDVILDRQIGTAGGGAPVVMGHHDNDVRTGGVITTAATRYWLSPRVQGDANGDGTVSGADYTSWADNFGGACTDFSEGDFNADGATTGADYTLWADAFGQSFDANSITWFEGEEFAPVDPVLAVGEGGFDQDFDVALNYHVPQMLQRGHYAPVGGVAVPEPSTFVLTGLALAGLAAYGLRRRAA